MKIPRYNLAELLKKDANNLNLVRLFAACLVFYSHAFVVQGSSWTRYLRWDPVYLYLKYDGVYASSIAVKIFFFISGLLVANSLFKKQSAIDFIIGRVCRIWPALVFILLMTTFAIGPLCSNLETSEYFRHPAVYRYLVENVLMQTNIYLPGVFVENPHPNEVNLSLWTLTYEVAAYGTLLILFLLRLTRSRIICSLLLIGCIVEPLLPKAFLFPWITRNPHFTYLPACFAMGAYLALWKDRITLGPLLVAGSITAFFALKSTIFGPHAFFFMIFITLLYLSGLPFIRKIKIGADPSYGMYLWGFLIQQIIASQFASLGWFFNLVSSLAIAFLIGLVSWHLVEKKAIAAGHRFASALTGTSTR